MEPAALSAASLQGEKVPAGREVQAESIPESLLKVCYGGQKSVHRTNAPMRSIDADAAQANTI